MELQDANGQTDTEATKANAHFFISYSSFSPQWNQGVYCSIGGEKLELVFWALYFQFICCPLPLVLKKGILRYVHVQDFNANKEIYRDRLNGLRDLIAENGVLDEKLLSNLEVEVRNYMTYSSIATLKDKWKTFWL